VIFRSLLSLLLFFSAFELLYRERFFSSRKNSLSLSLSRFLLEDDDDDDDDQKMFIIHIMALYERVPRFEKKSHKTPLALDAKRKTIKKKDQKRRRKRG